MISLFTIGFLTESLLIFLFTIYQFYKAYKLTLSLSNLLFAAGTTFVLLSYCVSFLLSFVPSTKKHVAQLIFSLVNSLLVFGLCLTTIALFYVRTKFFNVTSIIFSFITGMIILILSSSSNVSVEYNPDLFFWVADYTSQTILLLSLFFIIIIILSGFYIAILLRYSIANKRFSFTLVGLLFLFLWLVTVPLTKLYVFRIFILPISFFFIGLDCLINPLSLLVSEWSPKELYVFSDNNMPLFGYDINNDKIISNLDEIRILRVGEILIEERISKSRGNNYFQSSKGEVFSMIYKDFIVTIIGRKIDANIKAAMRKAINEIIEKVDIKQLGTSGLLSAKEEEQFITIFKENIRLVCYK